MSVQRIFSLVCCVIALFGIIGSLQEPLFHPENDITVAVVAIDRGFFPFLYSALLLLFGLLLFFLDKSNKKFNFRASLLSGTGGKAVVFLLLNFLLLLLIYIFGPFIGVLGFSILACLSLKQLTPKVTVLFSIIFTMIFYFLFVTLFRMPFRRGIIFELLGWYI